MKAFQPNKWKMNPEFTLIVETLRKALKTGKSKGNIAQVGHKW